VIAEDLKGHAVLLFRTLDLVVEFGVVKCEAAVHGKRLKRFLVLLQSESYSNFEGKISSC
jgi:hypothetical protein